MTFNVNGGTGGNIDYGKVSEIKTLPEEPKRQKFQFDGWYENASCTGNPITVPYSVTKDTTLYAKWLELYTVTFETNSGNLINSLLTRRLETADVQFPQKTGYTFMGWYKDSSFSQKVVLPCNITADTTFYAKWVQNFTVTFNSNGGSSVSPIQGYEGYEINTAPTTTKSDSSFAGWWTGENGTGDKVTFPYTVTQNITLYAKWSLKSKWEVRKSYNNVNDCTIYTFMTPCPVNYISFLFLGYEKYKDAKDSKVYVGHHWSNYYDDNDGTFLYKQETIDTVSTLKFNDYAYWYYDKGYSFRSIYNAGTYFYMADINSNSGYRQITEMLLNNDFITVQESGETSGLRFQTASLADALAKEGITVEEIMATFE